MAAVAVAAAARGKGISSREKIRAREANHCEPKLDSPQRLRA
jgi:hypothetical protein